jgi:hypothetical protein
LPLTQRAFAWIDLVLAFSMPRPPRLDASAVPREELPHCNKVPEQRQGG